MADQDRIEVDFSAGIKGLNKLSETVQENVRRKMVDVGEDLLRVSQEQVPHDEGTLQKSGTVDTSQIMDDNPTVIIGYNQVYAARLHEHPEYRFQKGRKGKFLEDPLKENSQKYGEHVAAALKQEL